MFYPPSEDTYLLEDALKERVEKEVKCIVEVGCGSGYLTNVLKDLYPLASIISTDINPYAVEEASRRCAANNTTVIRASMLDGIKTKVDVVVFNPPYLPSEEKYLTGDWIDRSWAGGADGMEVCNKFLKETAHVPIRYVLLCQFNKPNEVIMRLRANRYSVEIIRQEKVLNERLFVIRIEIPENKKRELDRD